MTIEKPKHPRHRGVSEGPPTYLYDIADPSHMPDLRGELAGARVMNGKVRLTEAAARFYVDSGALRRVEKKDE